MTLIDIERTRYINELIEQHRKISSDLGGNHTTSILATVGQKLFDLENAGKTAKNALQAPELKLFMVKYRDVWTGGGDWKVMVLVAESRAAAEQELKSTWVAAYGDNYRYRLIHEIEELLFYDYNIRIEKVNR